MLKDNPYIGVAGGFLIAALFVISGLGTIASPAMMQGVIASAGLPFPLFPDEQTVHHVALTLYHPVLARHKRRFFGFGKGAILL